ncbi:precorrin-8X methylmutase [Gloeomargarita lithophora Alchichica-D10]|uniref:Precorrin-8X methylmutase n=1 Tax=Gloeomargarita lithophora Alchichica-D10 TaxID=1188229 RepID=A0A1J0AEL2_9CYAN|nr:precorrin-8X methylmutase [Gloeomargarita lithophora]APB34352.1 precorrin-8X methylmutase [Gloeomargarita lithophora Alchichica-D10]
MDLDPITAASFAIIDREIGSHPWGWTEAEYSIIRRVIHATADFEFKYLLRFSPGAIWAGIRALRNQVPLVTDVGLVAQGVKNHLALRLPNALVNALDLAPLERGVETRSALGMAQALGQYPGAMVVIGNAPTALAKLCELYPTLPNPPALVIAAPVGFVNVLEAKAQLAEVPIPQIAVQGRKGGSPAAAAITNALIDLATLEPPHQVTGSAD